ncbi:hypothetical protein E2C01_096353 [Portunus trituberculatus]|uniref:Uncharacterized protein n=1 Tax=Portunus trituberculatus TaxID=210409 RepID=A0A5B7K1I3_PORTR|nr:hypothetical protein [Portunus trituberculatus]
MGPRSGPKDHSTRRRGDPPEADPYQPLETTLVQVKRQARGTTAYNGNQPNGLTEAEALHLAFKESLTHTSKEAQAKPYTRRKVNGLGTADLSN